MAAGGWERAARQTFSAQFARPQIQVFVFGGVFFFLFFPAIAIAIAMDGWPGNQETGNVEGKAE